MLMCFILRKQNAILISRVLRVFVYIYFLVLTRSFRLAVVRPQLPSLCSLGFNAGLCSTVAVKWFYNVTSDKCQMQNFSSCRGNTNRFDDKTQCMTTCKPNACKPPACARVCPFGLAEDDNGCEICECFNPCKVRWLSTNQIRQTVNV